ncbi:MAG: hypothetical protein H0W34_09860, partial [Pyrinomonadaceae bacterium]|nr:hypothetical protein [Pyrinomonadaceae bacterium]
MQYRSRPVAEPDLQLGTDGIVRRADGDDHLLTYRRLGRCDGHADNTSLGEGRR